MYFSRNPDQNSLVINPNLCYVQLHVKIFGLKCLIHSQWEQRLVTAIIQSWQD